MVKIGARPHFLPFSARPQFFEGIEVETPISDALSPFHREKRGIVLIRKEAFLFSLIPIFHAFSPGEEEAVGEVEKG